MEKNGAIEDRQLVQECLAGSEKAWRDFYSRFICLMRCVVKRHTGLPTSEVDDITQCAFLSLTTALNSYDSQHSLSTFVCMVTERAAIDEYRKLRAAKRSAETENVELFDQSGDGARMIQSNSELQDEQIEKKEEISILRQALTHLDAKCRELVEMRYYHELSFGQIAQSLGESENTVTVRTRRCLDKLRAACHHNERRGKTL
jgi:RNA polymerase sigma factor (sigma-70 family)